MLPKLQTFQNENTKASNAGSWLRQCAYISSYKADYSVAHDQSAVGNLRCNTKDACDVERKFQVVPFDKPADQTRTNDCSKLDFQRRECVRQCGNCDGSNTRKSSPNLKENKRRIKETCMDLNAKFRLTYVTLYPNPGIQTVRLLSMISFISSVIRAPLRRN